MSDFDRVRMLDFFNRNILAGDLNQLCYLLYGKRPENLLSQSGLPTQITEFLEKVETECDREKVSNFYAYLCKKFPDQFSSEFPDKFSEKSNKKIPEPVLTDFVNFQNRKEELRELVSHPLAPYYLIDAPAGYGKTALLLEAEKKYKEKKWLCSYISLKQLPAISDVFWQLKEKTGCDFEINIQDSYYDTGSKFGKAMANLHQEQPGLVLIFDADEILDEKMSQVMKQLIEEFVPAVWNELSQASNFFDKTPLIYRVIIAGRYLNLWVKKNCDIMYSFMPMVLKPFVYRSVQESVQNLCSQIGKHDVDTFAANLLFHSGGHPRCMVRMMDMYKELGGSPDDFFKTYTFSIKEKITYPEAYSVRHNIDSEWRLFFDQFCFFRYFDIKMMKLYLENGKIGKTIAENEYDLRAKLLKTQLITLMEGNQRLHKDDITRRLLFIGRRSDMSENEFAATCHGARQICISQLESANELKHFWAIESLFLYLYEHVADITTDIGRKKLKEKIFIDEIPIVLKKLIGDKNPLYEIEPLESRVNDDVEFQFTLNYFLRDKKYNNEPFNEFNNRLHSF